MNRDGSFYEIPIKRLEKNLRERPNGENSRDSKSVGSQEED